MPVLQLMAERANAVFNRTNIRNLNSNTFEGSFSSIAGALGIAQTETEREFLDSWPVSLQEGIKAIIRSAIQRDNPLPVTICWAPGYDFEILVSESRSVAGSMGGITLFLRSRYPGDSAR